MSNKHTPITKKEFNELNSELTPFVKTYFKKNLQINFEDYNNGYNGESFNTFSAETLRILIAVNRCVAIKELESKEIKDAFSNYLLAKEEFEKLLKTD